MCSHSVTVTLPSKNLTATAELQKKASGESSSPLKAANQRLHHLSHWVSVDTFVADGGTFLSPISGWERRVGRRGNCERQQNSDLTHEV